MGDPPLGHLLPVDAQRRGSALAASAAVVGEVEPHLGLAGRHGPLGGHRVRLAPDPVVRVGRPAVLEEEAPPAEAARLGQHHPARAALRDLEVGDDRLRAVLDVHERVLEHAGHAVVERERRAAGHEVRTPGDRGVEPLDAPVVDRQHAVLHRLPEEELLQLRELLGVLRGEVVGEAEVVRPVVELPPVVFERRAGRRLPRGPVDRAGEPAVVVNGPVAGDLEVLGDTAAPRLGVAERVGEAHALDRRLGGPVDRPRLGQACHVQDGRRDVDHVVELRADLAPSRDPLRPADHHAVGGAAEVGGDLLGVGERRVPGHRPADRVVREGLRAAPPVELGHDLRQRLGHPVEEAHLVEHAGGASLRARAVVPRDVDEERVVQDPQVLERRHEPADLVVDVLAEAREDLHLAREEALLVRRERVPVLDGRRLGRELRARRHEAERDLPRERLLPVLVPARVEAALVLVRPLPRDVVGRVGGARGEVDEEGLVRRERLLRAHPGDGPVGEVRAEVVRGIGRHLDLDRAVVQQGRPLVGLAAEEAVELLEAGTGRPEVERARGARLPQWRQVPLAECGGVVAVEPQDLGEGSDALGALAGLAGERRRHVLHGAGVVGVVVAAGEQRRPRRGAQRARVEVVVAQALAGEAVERGHGDAAAERAGLPEAHVVDEDEHHVRGPGGCLHLEARGRRRLAHVERGDRGVLRLRDGEHGTVEGRALRGESEAGCAQECGRDGSREASLHGPFPRPLPRHFFHCRTPISLCGPTEYGVVSTTIWPSPSSESFAAGTVVPSPSPFASSFSSTMPNS